MKTKSNIKKGSRLAWSSCRPTITRLALSVLILTGMQLPLQAQDAQPVKKPQFTKPTWWYGAAVGANLNFYRGTTQELNADLTVPTAFGHGQGVGLYLAPLVEYQKPDSRWGVMFQAGYDGRNGKFEHVITPCNCRADLSTNLHYITVEPSLRFAPWKSNFYFFGGPRLAFNVAKSFTYSLQTNPDVAEQVANADVKGDFSNVHGAILSMQIGAGYDIPLSTENKQRQTVLSPFISFQPYFGQDPRSIETWNVTTLRIGAALKFGKGKLITEPAKAAEIIIVDPSVKFTVVSPSNIPVERRVRETFPVRNYVFFDIGSTQIPNRYVLLTKNQVKDFKEDQLEVFTPKRLSGRSDREMVVYYNLLNILGDRMAKNPSTEVRLTGASMKGVKTGMAMAESVKSYLVNIFGVEPSRIKTEGRTKPRIPSEQPGGKQELGLLREGDNRVSIWSESPALMMEFQSGPDAPLKPVEIIAVQQAPPDSYVTFNADGATEAFKSWSLEMKDSKGVTQYFGPYTQEKVSIPGKTILGARPQGDFTATMVGQTKSGKTVRQEAPVHMVLWTPPTNEEGMRFSVIFEFNQSEAIATYEKYLTNVVAPKIPSGATVIIHGHTDIIGDEASNEKLSMARAMEVKGILESALSKAGRSDVKFETYGYGEDQTLAPFANNFPEERFYNRTVLIDVIPKK